MPDAPQAAPFRPETAILSLGDDFYDPVKAADFPQTILRFRNQRAAETVGLGDLDEAAWLRHFGRFEALPGSLEQPLALRYHGHQFRNYNPDIGDGRGFLFAQLRDADGRLLDLGTKGSGQTPYSRFGDGRLTLKGGVREVLATEMLEALGVNTSRTFSLIETGETLERNDEPSPTRSAVLVRLNHGHIRIGTFQRLAFFQQEDELRRLTDYCLIELYGDQPGEDGPGRLLDHVVSGTARLAASYMAAGFVHGVLNSDNINVTAESFDYGPWRFAKTWDPRFTAAYFDQQGLYAFGRQAEAILWDVYQLAGTLALISPVEPLQAAVDAFPARFEAAMRAAILGRLGVKPKSEEDDLALMGVLESALMRGGVEIDRFFFDWAGGRRRGASPADYSGEAFAGLEQALAGYEPSHPLDHPYWGDAVPCSMHIEEVEAIWARIAEADDWSAFEAKVAAIRRMGEAMRG
ncbi:protein adenylyltransferase SelO family protein [Sphingomonas sp. ID0503]|uniref:protein adenylyltransferase SelO family protein n=1 Tax=Sphingomonas sp. ID0503 TaxID=3399691 RepID=UPI003AFA7AF0